MTRFLTLTVNGLANGAILAITALGFVLIYKATQVINFAQGQFLVFGAFMVYTANREWGLPWPLAVGVGIGSGVLLGLTIERLILRRMIGEAPLSVIMVTIGLASVLAGVALGVWGAGGRRGPDFIPAGAVRLGDVSVAANRLWAVGIATVVLIAVGLFFQKSRHGVAMRAVADDQQAAMVQGINVNRIFAMAWALAGAAGAIGGVLLASIANSYDAPVLEGFAVFVFPVVILGGLDSVLGTIVGGVIVGLLVEYSKSYLSVSMSVILPFTALVLILLIRPYGLFGQVRIERV